MATANLHNTGEQIDASQDGIVIKQHADGYQGGRTLDTTDFTPTVIKAGHVIIKDGSGNFKPMPISGSDYAALPASHSYVGILAASILTAKPFAAIMTKGTVNPNAAPYAYTAILSAFKTAVPHIEFRAD